MKLTFPTLVALIACAAVLPAQTYFFETFDNNSNGWTLGPEWGIGPATASSGGVGNPDPDTDAAGILNGGVAGVVIGGNASTALHDFYWLESPPIDTAGASNLTLAFHRWLNSDYTPFMQNRVQVYDGSWHTVWQSGSSPAIFDSSWNLLGYDISQYAHKAMRVRFGFNVGNSGAYTIGSWNLDNVRIFKSNCLFFEPFDNNAAGWTLGTEWGIGAATASTGGSGNPDPGFDGTGTGAGGVAGVVIGGNASTALHPFYYLESPPIDTTPLSQVQFSYQRWLNSDYTPFMQNNVEVYDGTAWNVIWQTGGYPNVADSSWVPQAFDITAYSNPALQVRFGFDVANGGAYTIGSWNLDNVCINEGTPLCDLSLWSVDNTATAGTVDVNWYINDGTPNSLFLAAGTTNPGNFPNGWFGGIDISHAELVAQVALGQPFLYTTDAAGNAGTIITIGVPVAPLGITLYWAGIDFDPATNVVQSTPPSRLDL